MSEKAPKNPEDAWDKKKFRDNCMNCDINFGLTKENTFAVIFEKDPDHNHLHVQCPDCGHEYKVFCGSETLELAADAGCMFNPILRVRDENGDIISEGKSGGLYAPPELVEMWQQVQGMELVQPVEISPRHEQQIQKFGETLTAMTENDPDGFWQDMSSEAPGERPYNNRWC